MAKTKKIIVAGSLVVEGIYPRAKRGDSDRARGEKKKLSSAAQQRMNQIYSAQKLEFMLAANFVLGDCVVLLTYDDDNLPLSRKEAEGRLKYFRAKLGKLRKAAKAELRMIWNTEGKHGEKRFHHHIVCNSTGDDLEDLQQSWSYGSVELKPLRLDKEKNYASLARYMCKETREKPGLRSWSYSRNCKHPEVESFAVPDDTTIQAPKGSVVLEEYSESNQYGNYKVVKYISSKLPRAPRARRRRKR